MSLIERASAARLRAFMDAGPGGTIDRSRLAEVAGELTPGERRYQSLNEAWSQAALDLQGRRPWRPAFTAVARAFAPFDLPARVRVLITIQQFAAPIAVILASVIMTPVVEIVMA